MTLWRNLVVAFVAAFALAACSSSGSGPSPDELDAANAAEAAKAAAEEAAAQARQEAIAEQQKMSVMAAITAAQEAVAALMDDSSDTDVAGATAEIAKATAAIAAATALTADQTAMYGAQVAAVQADLALAEANIRAYRAEQAAEEATQQATAADRAKTAVENAIAALTAAGEAETMAEATYTTAAAALATAQQAVADADSDTLAEASAALAQALIAASTASAELAVQTQAVADATATLMAARAVLAEADPDHVALMAANAALEKAMADKDALTERVAALQKQIEDLMAAQQKADEERRMAEEQRAAEQMKADMAAAGKALKAALGDNPLDLLTTEDIGGTSYPTLDSSGLTVGITNAPTATPPVASAASPAMEAVEGSDGTLGDWNSMKYMHTNTGTKVTHEAMVYTNPGAPSVKPFATGATQAIEADGAITPTTADAAPASAWEYQASSGTLRLAAATLTGIKGDEFPSAGRKNYTPGVSTAVLFRGTYQGAPGQFRCTGTGCSATAAADGDVTLAGTWDFIHAPGAMTSKPDANYLYFGWWLSKDKDGDPTAASAFTGVVGDVDGTQTLTDPLGLTGSATYTGKAAGKFAISHPINGGDAGHFTADATLTAKFGAAATSTVNNANGLSGTLDNFMANDKSVPWSVSLLRANLNTTGGTVPFNDPDTAGVDEAVTATVWSIDGNSATASGSWSAQLYDEKPGDAPDGDGSNVATSVIGTFESHFGSDHTMVGAFGAEVQ